MLVELHVRDLGVIESVTVELGGGMTALTGETGAGKTLLVEALELLLGGKADPGLVRPGASEALVEARFVDAGGSAAGAVGDDDDGDDEDDGDGDDEDDGDDRAGEVILARTVPASGRSRAWVDGRMATMAALEEAGRTLADLHGQHAHQSLLDPAAQRRALDRFGDVDVGPLRAARAEVRALEAELARFGGDERSRAREADLLRYQLEEIDAARITADEDEVLAEEEERLASMAAHLEAAAGALGSLDDEGGAVDALGAAAGTLDGRRALDALAARARALQAETADLASELRVVVETWEDDPARLDEVRSRRNLLHELSRKYGDGPGGVLAYAERTRAQLAELESHDERARALGEALEAARGEVARAEAAVGKARRAVAPALATAVEAHLRTLAMPHARLEVAVGGDDPGDDVVFRLGANPGEPVLPLAKVASGGELARTMLALRLVLTDAPGTVVFDEVDAGIGGEAAVAVGRALAEVARRHQVLVVTHLAQVASCADHQLGVRKAVVGDRTVAEVEPLEGEARVVELARMLSGRPDSSSARRHAEELLASAPPGPARTSGPPRRRRPGG
ncbi:MAG TPA: DNA repair protein RecN [Acidimicrobiales bacterium]|nr:DNA repair protein RecN [Acidimicrobiales bacterium]